MSRFLKLNGNKIKFLYKVISIPLLIIVISLLIFLFYNGAKQNISDVIISIAFATLIMPLIIISASYFEWFWKQKIKDRTFSKHPFALLDKIGFSKTYINDNTKWKFTEETLGMKIKGYELICNVERGNSKFLTVATKVEHKKIERAEFEKLVDKFEKSNVILYFESIIKLIPVKSKIDTANELRTEIENFVELIIQSNFKPSVDSK